MTAYFCFKYLSKRNVKYRVERPLRDHLFSFVPHLGLTPAGQGTGVWANIGVEDLQRPLSSKHIPFCSLWTGQGSSGKKVNLNTSRIRLY
jgi:hypothetical protein